MADDDDLDDDLDDDEDDLDDDEEGEDGEGGSGGNKKLLILVGVALFIVIGGAAAAYFTGLLEPLVGGEEEVAEEQTEEEVVLTGDAVFYDLPELLVNLNTAGRKSTFLKIRVSLELVDQGDIPRIEALLPRIIDNFQVYLRELRIEDLKGSAGMYRLREEMMRRVRASAAPAKVNDILFKEMIVQ